MVWKFVYDNTDDYPDTDSTDEEEESSELSEISKSDVFTENEEDEDEEESGDWEDEDEEESGDWEEEEVHHYFLFTENKKEKINIWFLEDTIIYTLETPLVYISGSVENTWDFTKGLVMVDEDLWFTISHKACQDEDVSFHFTLNLCEVEGLYEHIMNVLFSK